MSDFSLPGSSLQSLTNILIAYSSAPDTGTMEYVKRRSGVDRSTVSRSNKFLAEIGILEGANSKTPTELGKRLGRALELNLESDAQMYWREAIQSNESYSSLINMVRLVPNGDITAYANRIIMASGKGDSQHSRTGARCLIDILLQAGFITETDGKIAIATSQESPKVSTNQDAKEATQAEAANANSGASQGSRIRNEVITSELMTMPQIAINIQLQLPETENISVYRNLFQALHEELLNPDK